MNYKVFFLLLVNMLLSVSAMDEAASSSTHQAYDCQKAEGDQENVYDWMEIIRERIFNWASSNKSLTLKGIIKHNRTGQKTIQGIILSCNKDNVPTAFHYTQGIYEFANVIKCSNNAGNLLIKDLEGVQLDPFECKKNCYRVKALDGVALPHADFCLPSNE